MMDTSPYSKKQIRERAMRYRRSLIKEKKDYGGIDDGAGKRYLVGPLFVLAGDLEKAIDYYQWYAKEFSDDSGEPIHYVYWALALLRTGNERDAERKFLEAAIQNIYILPFLLGLAVEEYDIWHGSNLVDPGYLNHIPDELLPSFTEAERVWIREKIESDAFQRVIKEYIATFHALKYEREVQQRGAILDSWRSFVKREIALGSQGELSTSNASREKCDSCGTAVPTYDGVCLSNRHTNRFLCSKCYNESISEAMGLNFDHLSFHPMTLTDKNNENHTFHFQTRLFGENVSIEALEIGDDGPRGYEFAIHGHAEDDLFGLFGKLVERIRRELERRHIEPSDMVTRYRITDGDTVRGRITWDDDTGGEVPCLVVDGKELSWHEFGRMLMTYEGFHFKLEILERDEDR